VVPNYGRNKHVGPRSVREMRGCLRRPKAECHLVNVNGVEHKEGRDSITQSLNSTSVWCEPRLGSVGAGGFWEWSIKGKKVCRWFLSLLCRVWRRRVCVVLCDNNI
jgi:hypothetical protein